MHPRPSIFAVRTPPAPPGARIGLLGGSFNPAHAGHRQISEIARRRLGLDKVWWIVTPGNPLKSHAELAPLARRLSDARRIADAAWIEITAFEVELGSSYTIETLRFLATRHRSARFVWLMGADNLATLHHWRNWRDIAATFPMAIVDRPGWHLRSLASPTARALARLQIPSVKSRLIAQAQEQGWVMLTGPLSPLSSTAIRTASTR